LSQNLALLLRGNRFRFLQSYSPCWNVIGRFRLKAFMQPLLTFFTEEGNLFLLALAICCGLLSLSPFLCPCPCPYIPPWLLENRSFVLFGQSFFPWRPGYPFRSLCVSLQFYAWFLPVRSIMFLSGGLALPPESHDHHIGCLLDVSSGPLCLF